MPPGVRHWEVVIALAIVVSYGTIETAFTGGIDISAAIVRFVLAGSLSWAAVALVERLWSAYAQTARQRQLEDYLAKRAEFAKEADDRRMGRSEGNDPT